jgi:hypothetical protein
MLAFVLFASGGTLPWPAYVTFLAIGGCAIGAVSVTCVISDIIIIRRIFYAPDAYLYALAPVPGSKRLAANVIAMAVLDIIPLAAIITGQVYLALSFVDANLWRTIWAVAGTGAASVASDVMFIIWSIITVIAAYLMVMMIILFCIAASKSFLYHMRASGLLAVLLGWGCFYVFSLLGLLLAPFGAVAWVGGMFFVITVTGGALPVYAALILLFTAVLFILTSKLTERKLNI